MAASDAVTNFSLESPLLFLALHISTLSSSFLSSSLSQLDCVGAMLCQLLISQALVRPHEPLMVRGSRNPSISVYLVAGYSGQSDFSDG